MNTAEKMTRSMIKLILDKKLKFRRDVEAFLGEHFSPELQGEERALARVNLGDALQSWFEEKLPDDQKLSTSFLKEAVGYIDWIAIAQAIDFGHWTNEITDDQEYEGFTNSLTFTVWHWIISGDETQFAYGYASLVVEQGTSEEAKAKDLRYFFWSKTLPSFKRNRVAASLTEEGINCVNWLEIVQTLSRSNH
jgi:hypothetical protein